MKLLILGATGAIGKITARTALERGHDITLYVRDDGRIPKDLRDDNRVRVS